MFAERHQGDPDLSAELATSHAVRDEEEEAAEAREKALAILKRLVQETHSSSGTVSNSPARMMVSR